MSSGTKVIKAALRLGGAYSSRSPADPESISIGMDVLNSLIQELIDSGMSKLGATVLKVPGDELNEPLNAYNAIVSILAVRLIPNFEEGRMMLSQTAHNNAILGYSFLQKAFGEVYVPRKKIPSTLPRGEGSEAHYYDDSAYFNKGDSFGG